ncbi:MAG: DUF3592 domain-containing protein [Acidobacteriota bacterium]
MGPYLENIWQLTQAGKLQGIWFCAAAYWLLVCGWSVVYQIRIRRWPSTEGVLESASVEEFGGSEIVRSDRDYRLESSYTYRVSGVDYSGSRVSPWVFIASNNLGFILRWQLNQVKITSPAGVTVFYNPKRPEKSFLIAPGRAGIAFTLLLAVAPALGYLDRFHAWW